MRALLFIMLTLFTSAASAQFKRAEPPSPASPAPAAAPAVAPAVAPVTAPAPAPASAKKTAAKKSTPAPSAASTAATAPVAPLSEKDRMAKLNSALDALLSSTAAGK